MRKLRVMQSRAGTYGSVFGVVVVVVAVAIVVVGRGWLRLAIRSGRAICSGWGPGDSKN